MLTRLRRARRPPGARLRVGVPHAPSHLRLVVSNRRPVAKVVPPLAAPLARLQLALRKPQPMRLVGARRARPAPSLHRGPRLAALAMAAVGVAALAAALGQVLAGVR